MNLRFLGFSRFFSILLMFLLGFFGAVFTSLTPVANLMRLEFLGEVTWLTRTSFDQTEVGGLSGITYNPTQQVYYTISDDRSNKAPARFYTLKIDWSDQKLTPEKVTLLAQTPLLTEAGETFPRLSIDAEGIATTDHSIWVASEGDISRNLDVFVQEFSLEGKFLQSLPIPEKFKHSETQGVRHNLGLESLALTPDDRYLFTATENALIQDGEMATLETGSPCRIIQYNLETGRPEYEFLYITEPIPKASTAEDGFQTNGLVDLIAMDSQHLITLERSFATGVENTIQLFEVSLKTADNIADIESLQENITAIKPATKTLISNLKSFNLSLDNHEGLTLGPQFPDGQSSLILVSDNNFNPLQVTQFLGFRLPIGAGVP